MPKPEGLKSTIATESSPEAVAQQEAPKTEEPVFSDEQMNLTHEAAETAKQEEAGNPQKISALQNEITQTLNNTETPESSGQEQSIELLDREAVEKIENAPAIRLYDKVCLLLVKAGGKPTSDIEIGGEWARQNNGLYLTVDSDLLQGAENLIKDLKLPYKKLETQTQIATDSENSDNNLIREVEDIIVGKDEASLDQYFQAKTHQEFGRAYGYPDTATEGFTTENTKDTIMAWNLPEEIKQSEYYPFIIYQLQKIIGRKKLK